MLHSSRAIQQVSKASGFQIGELLSDRTAAAHMDSYHVDLRLESQARGKPQRANGAWIYLIDDRGNRYAPEWKASDIPLDVLIQPGQSIDASRTFEIHPGSHVVGVVTGHREPYCGPMSILIIGSGGCLFEMPTMIRFDEPGN